MTTFDGRYEFRGGFPTEETVTTAYDNADFVRAVTCYKHFFPVAETEGFDIAPMAIQYR